MARRYRGTGATRRPALPPPSDPRFLDAVKEVIEQFGGQRGDSQDRAVTFRDLEDALIAKDIVDRGLGGGSGSGAGGGAGGVPPIVTVPPPVKDFAAGAAFTRVILSWGTVGYLNHAHTEIRRAAVDDLSQAVTVGVTPARTYVDVTGGGFTGYYWARHVSTSGTNGPWSASVYAETPRDFDVIRDEATSREWEPDTVYSLFNPVSPTEAFFINDIGVVFQAVQAGTSGSTEPDWFSGINAIGDTIADGTVVWQAVEAGKIPFLIDPETGQTVIEGAAIRKASIEWLQVRDGFFDNMTAAKGTLSEANITIANIFNAIVENYIQSDIYSPGASGWRINRDGNAEFNNLNIRGLVHNGNLNSNGDPTGNSRYIDFRPGSANNGDFVLGDVDNGNYVSFKHEPAFGGRILRIRGDVALRNYEPGNIELLHNDATRTVSSTPVVIPFGDNLSTPTQGQLQSMTVVKRTVVSREGVLRVRRADVRYHQSGAAYRYGQLYYLCVLKVSGAVVNLKFLNLDNDYHIGDSWYQHPALNAAVLPGEMVEVRFAYARKLFDEDHLPLSEGTARNLRLSIGFYPAETALL